MWIRAVDTQSGPARPALQGGQAAALHRGGLRPGGLGAQDLVRGDTRRRAELRLVNLNGVLGTGKGVSAKFSSNANTGGTCFGDSGGPIFVSGTTTLVAVVSFGTSSNCSGTSGAYRLDQADDLAFLATFGITPEGGRRNSSVRPHSWAAAACSDNYDETLLMEDHALP